MYSLFYGFTQCQAVSNDHIKKILRVSLCLLSAQHSVAFIVISGETLYESDVSTGDLYLDPIGMELFHPC